MHARCVDVCTCVLYAWHCMCCSMQAVMMLLKKEGIALHSAMLTSLASSIASDPFAKIKKLIQDLLMAKVPGFVTCLDAPCTWTPLTEPVSHSIYVVYVIFTVQSGWA